MSDADLAGTVRRALDGDGPWPDGLREACWRRIRWHQQAITTLGVLLHPAAASAAWIARTEQAVSQFRAAVDSWDGSVPGDDTAGGR